MLTFATEAWADALPELEKHWPNHWAEVAMDRDHIPLAPDYAEYARFAANGSLHLTAARSAGALAGYVTAIVRPHLHYRDLLCAFWDLYYLAPPYRQGLNGLRLISAATAEMDRRGVRKHFSGTKKSKDMSALFTRLGWVEAETLFTRFEGGN